MFLLLSRVLLWLLIGTIVYSLFQRFYPSGTFVGRLILVVILVIIALSFVNPNEPAVASLSRLLSFPLKPLGASILMMIFAAQRIKGGGIEKPGGYLIGWALTILLLASTPAVAYFLYRAPLAMASETYVATAAPTSGTLVALGQPSTTANISDVTGDRILSYNLRVPPYLLQGNLRDIRTRGLRLEDFVPNAETLQLTTRTWESYLFEIYRFLRVQR
ncbi:septal nanopore formation protein FraI [Nostoc sp.]